MYDDSTLRLYEKGKTDLMELKKAIVFDGSGINPEKSDDKKIKLSIERIHVTGISDSKNESYYELIVKMLDKNNEWNYEELVCSKKIADYMLQGKNHLDLYALVVKDSNRLNLVNCIGINEAEELLNITQDNFRDNILLSCFLQYPDKHKDRILRRIKHGLPSKLGTGIRRDFFPENNDDIKMEYEICKNIIPEYIWNKLGYMIKNQTNTSLSSSQKSNIKRAIDYLLSYSFETKPKKICADDLLNSLSRGFYGRDDIKNEIVNIFSIRRNKNGIPKIICITGKNGLGKALISKTIAEATSDFYEFLSIDGSMHETDVFLGSSDIYDNCKHGEFAEMLYRIGNSGCMIIDGFKDAKSDIKANLERSLQTGEFTDMMLQVPIPLGDMTFILIAEDGKDIPRKLYDIGVKLHLDSYTEEDRIKIGHNYILPNIKREFGIENTEICMSDEVKNFLCNLYIVTSSMDEVVANYRKLIGKFVADNKISNKEMKKASIAMQYVKKVFGIGKEHSAIVKDVSALEKKFRENRYRFPKEEQELIQNLFEEYYSHDEKSSDRSIIKDKIVFAVNFIPSKKDIYNDNIYNIIKQIRKKLDEEMYGHEESKKTVIRAISEGYVKHGEICGNLRLFLHGAAGTGKTSISKIIANVLGIPFIKISLNGMSEEEIIKGFSSGFSNSKMGTIAEKLMENGTRRAVLLFDEVEKASVSVINTLYDIVDPNEGQYYDNYLDRCIPTDELIMIAAGNDISTLPAAFLDRFEMVNLSGYTEIEREEIAKNYVYPKIMKEMGLEGKITIDNEALSLIATEYVHQGSVRPIEKKIKQVILDNLDVETYDTKRDGAKSNTVIHITNENVYSSLGAIPIKSGNKPCVDVYPPGVCNCLGVRGGLGNVFPVEVVKTPYLKKGRITGLPKKVMKDSIYNAEIFVSNLLGRQLETTSILFAEGAISKDGPSAGAAIATALISSHTGIAVDKGVAFTGEIDILGYIYAIGGEEEKLSAALSEGLTKVFIPYDNYRVLKENEKLDRFKGISIIPVRHLSEIISNLFPMYSLEKEYESNDNVSNLDIKDTYKRNNR